MFMRKLPQPRTIHTAYLEIRNNPSEETIFGSNKIKEQHVTMKLKMKKQ